MPVKQKNWRKKRMEWKIFRRVFAWACIGMLACGLAQDAEKTGRPRLMGWPPARIECGPIPSSSGSGGG